MGLYFGYILYLVSWIFFTNENIIVSDMVVVGISIIMLMTVIIICLFAFNSLDKEPSAIFSCSYILTNIYIWVLAIAFSPRSQNVYENSLMSSTALGTYEETRQPFLTIKSVNRPTKFSLPPVLMK